MPQYILACKELNGLVQLARLPQTVDNVTPGVPSAWFTVGPGLRPSIQEYNGTQFVLTFDYLSHLFTRIVDISTWPPNVVNPVQVTGGPNPPTAFAYNIQLSQDALSLKTESQSSFGISRDFFNPVFLAQPTIFDDPLTNSPNPTFSVTLTPVPSFAPQTISPSVIPFYRLYRRTFTPVIGPWIMIMDWNPVLNHVDSNIGSLRFQYSATWGAQFNLTDQWNPNVHNEGIVGERFITVDSTIGHLNFQFFLNETLTLDQSTRQAFGIFGSRQSFIVEGPDDAIQLSKSLVGQSSEAFAQFFARSAFVYTAAEDNEVFPVMGGVTPGPNNFNASSFSMAAFIGA